MPTYEYRCRACGHELEHFQSMTADPLSNCPACGQADLKRLIGAGAGLIFKGSGYYQTDYRSEAYKADAKKDKDSQTKKDGGSGKTDTPAKKTESKPAPKSSSSPDSSSKPGS